MVTKRRRSFFFLLILVHTAALAATPPVGQVPTKQILSSQERFILRHQTLQAIFAKQAGTIENASAFASKRLSNRLESVPKSKPRAFLQSLILPGWGQHYAGSKTMMKVFAATEVVLWGTFMGLNVWSDWLTDDFRTFAATHAAADIKGKPDSYFVDIGNFGDIVEYNQAQLRNRDVTTLYPETEEFFWRWDSVTNRREFRDMRVRSDRASNRAEFALAGIVLNHFLSAIHSTLAVHKFNKRLAAQKLGMKLDFDAISEDRVVRLSLSRHF
jgi:hypothetical protein